MYTAPLQITAKQSEWLMQHFKHTKNAECAKKLGISESSLHRIARELGLKKTPQFMRKCQAATAKAAQESHIANGTYPPKGFIIPKSENYRFKKGETPLMRHGKAKEAARIKKSTEAREATRRAEKRRILFGLPQKTKLRLVSQPRKKCDARWYLKSKGYILDEEKRIAYWNADTHRAPRLEARESYPYTFASITQKDAPNEHKATSVYVPEAMEAVNYITN